MALFCWHQVFDVWCVCFAGLFHISIGTFHTLRNYTTPFSPLEHATFQPSMHSGDQPGLLNLRISYDQWAGPLASTRTHLPEPPAWELMKFLTPFENFLTYFLPLLIRKEGFWNQMTTFKGKQLLSSDLCMHFASKEHWLLEVALIAAWGAKAQAPFQPASQLATGQQRSPPECQEVKVDFQMCLRHLSENQTQAV